MKAIAVWTMALLSALTAAGANLAATGETRFFAAEAILNTDRVAVVEQETFSGYQGVTLKDGVASLATDPDSRDPELTFWVHAPAAGYYSWSCVTAVDEYGKTLMPKWTRLGTEFSAKILLDDEPPQLLTIFSPWRNEGKNTNSLGIIRLTGKRQKLVMQLPRGVRLESVAFNRVKPLKVPEKMQQYQPVITPPPVHPRVWVTPESLRKVRANLKHPENAAIYRRLLPGPFKMPEVNAFGLLPDSGIENAITARALVHLLEPERGTGKEAVAMTMDYFRRVRFGNILDVSREIGRIIYTGALVYDWCYDLMSGSERRLMREKMMEWAMQMEAGWPPVKQKITVGHGNEWQLSRDLLAMAIAIYDEDPVPYRYLSYAVLEELVPLARYAYQSPRHNQGTNYGYLRYGCDLHAAALMERMSGRPVFDPNIYQVFDYWTYLRVPGGACLPEGDCWQGDQLQRYWSYPLTALLAQAGSRSAQLKGEVKRQQSFRRYPMMSLLFNDPAIPTDETFDTLPPVKDFGTVLGGMAVRTGWNIAADSSDVVAFINGGGRNFGNHHHSDNGAVQLYYRGMQIGDIGQYKFYGTPYEFGFNKRSVAHSMMLVRDPAEKMPLSPVNDGGIPLNQTPITNPEQAENARELQRGHTVGSAFGPDPFQPEYASYAVDLTEAYGTRLAHYVRNFVFFRSGDPAHPAVVVLYDAVESRRVEFVKYFQLNTWCVPQVTADGFRTEKSNAAGKGEVYVSMLMPQPGTEAEMTILSGDDATNVFGTQLTPPRKSVMSRVMFRPEKARREDHFLCVMQPVPAGTPPFACRKLEFGPAVAAVVADRIAVFQRSGEFFTTAFRVTVPGDETEYRMLVNNLAPGRWRAVDAAGTVLAEETLTKPALSLYFRARPGSVLLQPVR